MSILPATILTFSMLLSSLSVAFRGIVQRKNSFPIERFIWYQKCIHVNSCFYSTSTDKAGDNNLSTKWQQTENDEEDLEDDDDEEEAESGPESASGPGTTYHIPVMLDECCTYLMRNSSNGLYIDGTLGGGGHTRGLLERGGRVLGLDQDPEAVREASQKLSEYIRTDRLEVVQRNFREMSTALRESRLAGGDLADGILLDLGVSSHQINSPARGFMFSADGPLDMRMSTPITATATGFGDVTCPDPYSINSSSTSIGSGGLTASFIVNTWDATAIANLLFEFGEEPRSRVLAREIVASRPLRSTRDLADAISRRTYFKHRTKTLARCFQALRIVVNDELRALDEALEAAHRCLRPGGRLAVLSYHSLEDRRVKRLMKTGSVSGESQPAPALYAPAPAPVLPSSSSPKAGSRRRQHVLHDGGPSGSASESESASGSPWRAVFKGALGPSEEEVARNSRARSAKLRVAELRGPEDADQDQGSDHGSGRPSNKSKYGAGLVGAKERKKRERERAERGSAADDG